MDSQAQTNQVSDNAALKPYSAPKLSELGSLTHLTNGMSGRYNDRRTMQMMSMGF